jgi:hypothetical protein
MLRSFNDFFGFFDADLNDLNDFQFRALGNIEVRKQNVYYENINNSRFLFLIVL